jgi:signal transduction histidine kinase
MLAGVRITELSQLVASEQVRLVYRHLPAAIIPPIVAAALIAFFLRDQIPHARLWFWVVWVAASYATFPTALYISYRWTAGAVPNPRVWGLRFAVMAFATALSWGSAGALLYVPGSALHQVFLGGMIFVSAASVLATTFAYTPGYYAGIIPIMLPIMMRFATAGTMEGIAIVAMMVLSFLMLGLFQYSLHKGLSDSLALRFEREALAMELAAKNLEVERASRAKSRFLAVASHDLRQPMHAQALFLAELDARINDPHGKAVVSHLRQSMQSMGKLLDGLLDISELDAGGVRANLRSFLLQPILDRIEREFQGLMTQKGLRFRVVPCPYAVTSDPVLLERILLNLVHNALRYTTTGAVMVSCRRRSASLAIEVRDSGVGIPQDSHQLIFEEFTQIGNPGRQRDKGLGLGLAIVIRLASLLKLAVDVRSEPGAGSVFQVSVPIARDFAAEMVWAGLPDRCGTGLAGLRVLVVDDDRAIMTAIGMLLERWRCESLLAENSHDAEQLAGAGDAPAVIIADYRLPGSESGIGVVRNIRARSKAPIPALLITGEEDEAVLREAQANDCIVMRKPVDPDALYAMLCNLAIG